MCCPADTDDSVRFSDGGDLTRPRPSSNTDFRPSAILTTSATTTDHMRELSNTKVTQPIALPDDTSKFEMSTVWNIISTKISGEHNTELTILPDRTVCGITEVDGRIYGGDVANIYEFPWIVRLKYKLTGEFIINVIIFSKFGHTVLLVLACKFVNVDLRKQFHWVKRNIVIKGIHEVH